MSEFKPFRPFQLKIKAASLAAEAKIIRRQERRLKQAQNRAKLANKPGYADEHRLQRMSLQDHRRGPVRSAARSTHLSLTFLSGKPYIAAEARRYIGPDWKAIWTMIERYGHGDKRDLAQRFEAWKQAGEEETTKL